MYDVSSWEVASIEDGRTLSVVTASPSAVV